MNTLRQVQYCVNVVSINNLERIRKEVHEPFHTNCVNAHRIVHQNEKGDIYIHMYMQDMTSYDASYNWLCTIK